MEQEKRGRSPESQRAGSCRRFDRPDARLHSRLSLRETCQTVGVRGRNIGRIYTMGLTIRPWRDPARPMIRAKSSFISNEPADTTDWKHCRDDEHLSPSNGQCPSSRLSAQLYKSHTPPLSFIRQTGPSRGSSRYT